MVGGEILIDEEGTSQRNNRDQVGRSHLCIDVVLGGSDGAIDFVGLHGGEIEEQNDEAAIFELVGRIGGGIRWGGTCWLSRRSFERSGLRHTLVGNSIDVLQIEGNDFLWFVVFENRKVFWFEATHEISTLVPDRHVD